MGKLRRVVWFTALALICLAAVSCNKQGTTAGALGIPAPNPADKLTFTSGTGNEHAAVAYTSGLPAGWPPKLLPPANCLVAEGDETSKYLMLCAEIDVDSLANYYMAECERLGLKPSTAELPAKDGASVKFIDFTYQSSQMSIMIYPQGGGLRSEPAERAVDFTRFMFKPS